ncbi:hypothetical protein ZEAMMB73_Zm00001d002818 [Zea mays]|uniref:Uncharacterized protein n=1 Tax=Zea mays TaxID=4577 RepID=A0A1D6E4L5_MAIZE|nr:hypothetical protein ZEAMMB73_Zm00001d002818 [Zea mays]
MQLSVGVAREFFALQDRLGFDKASKTVNWLLAQSKPAIDRLNRARLGSERQFVAPPNRTRPEQFVAPRSLSKVFGRRRDWAFCKRHDLSARGSNADLIARLDAAIGRAVSAEEEVAGVAARKGCVRQIGGDADETKKVTFVEVGGDVPLKLSRRNSLAAHVPMTWSRRNSLGADVLVRQSSRNSLCAEAQDCELRSQVTCSPVVAKPRGKSAQAGSVEVGAVVPLRRSRRNSLRAAESEEVQVAVFVDRKRKCKNQENDKGVALSAQVGASSRVTRRSSHALSSLKPGE